MSTTVTYKGNTLTTVSNATKTLKTAGKYMEGDVQLTDTSSTIVVAETLDANGGIIKTITTTDEVNLQTKTITPTSSVQTVNPDTGYDGFSQVIVNAGGEGGVPHVWQDQDGYVHLDDEETSQIVVEPLSVTQNGTYTAPTGKAYSPVTVNVSGGVLSRTLKITVINNSSNDISVDSLVTTYNNRLYYISPTDGLAYTGGSGGMYQTISAHTTYEMVFVCGSGYKSIEIDLDDHGLTCTFSDMVNIYEEVRETGYVDLAFDDSSADASMTITLT